MAAKRAKKAKPRKKRLRGTPNGELNGFPVLKVRVKDLLGHAAPYNPRQITESALAGLKASVDEFGLPQPIVVNKRTNFVVGGHQRLRTLDPDSETDVVLVDLDPEKEKALNVALNSSHITGDWSSSLKEILDSFDELIPDLSSALNFDDLRMEVPSLAEILPPDEFPEVDEDLETNYECPKCGFEFS